MIIRRIMTILNSSKIIGHYASYFLLFNSKNLIIIVLALLLVLFMSGFVLIYIKYKFNLNQEHKNTKYVESMFDHIKEAMVIYDGYLKKLVFVSDNIEKIIGLTKEDISKNKKLYDINNILISEDIFKTIFEKNQNAIVFKEYKIETKNNLRKTIRVRIFDCIINNNKCYCIIFADITTEVLNRTRLELSLNKAKNDIDDMSVIMTKISHQLRTPINGVIGMSEMARQKINEGDYKAVRDYLLLINQTSKSISDLINENLGTDKYKNLILSFELLPVKVRDVVTEAVALISPALEESGLTLLTKIDTTDDELLIDRKKLMQIFINIISYSVKYCKKNGKIVLTVISKPVSDKFTLHIELNDNGIGITEEEKKNILENSQAEDLGLVVVSNIVSLFSGIMAIDSKIGVGTKVTLDFIINKYDNSPTKIVDEDDLDMSDIHALVAEDNDINWLILENYLKLKKINYKRVKDGLEALNTIEEAKEWEYNIILMDIQMPRMNGYEAAMKIRELNRSDNKIGIIALSADAYDNDVNKALTYKMNAHVAKPIKKEDLYNKIKKYAYQNKENSLY